MSNLVGTNPHALGGQAFETGWRIEGAKGAASILNLHPSTLRFRIKKLGIKR